MGSNERTGREIPDDLLSGCSVCGLVVRAIMTRGRSARAATDGTSLTIAAILTNFVLPGFFDWSYRGHPLLTQIETGSLLCRLN
jgi:hypothetical protein